MSNDNWLFFSFTLPAKNQAGRMRVWRRLTALGAVIVKGAFYALPLREELREQLSWLAKEAEGLGGEAMLLASGAPANMTGPELAALFTKARDEDWQALEAEALALLDQARGRAGADHAHGGESTKGTAGPDDPVAALTAEALAQARRKLARRADALAAIDYFPSGRGGRVLALIGELDGLLSGVPAAVSGEGAPGVPLRDPADWRGLIWITRARPYIDRLASFWLVRRFIDPEARIAFVPKGDRPAAAAGTARFDMDEAEFTHVGPLTTFEVICAAFGLGASVPAGMRETIRAIDLDGLDSGPHEAHGVKRVLDGLCALTSSDDARTLRALELFDALLASYSATKGE